MIEFRITKIINCAKLGNESTLSVVKYTVIFLAFFQTSMTFVS